MWYFEEKNKKESVSQKSNYIFNICIYLYCFIFCSSDTRRTNVALTRLNLIENANESVDISYYTLVESEFTDVLLGSILEAANGV